MAARVLTIALVLAAALADAAGAHVVAFYALVVAVPAAAAVSLWSFGSALDAREDPVAMLQTLLWALCLALVVIGCAARAPALETARLPTFAASTLDAVLGVLAVKATVAAGALVRIRLVRGAHPRVTRA
jgi:hypothetical protein